MPRKRGKVDRNHKEIVDALRQAYGPRCVVSLASIGDGCPDILVGIRGYNILMEIKSEGGRLTNDQIHMINEWQGQITLVYTVEEALAAIERITT